MFKTNNYNYGYRSLQQYRFYQKAQIKNTAATVNKANEPAAEFSTEWEQARTYNEIPHVTTFSLLSKMLPGGKYHKLEMSKVLLELRAQHGDIYRFSGMFGKPPMVITNDPNDFERVYRNEGVWPERPGMDAIHYYRNVHRKDFFEGVEGLMATKGDVWGSFRSSVNPVLMQPKTVRLYYEKMSQVNQEFINRIREIRDPQTLEVPENFEEEINRWTLESVSVVALDKQLGLINANRNKPEAKKLFKTLTEFLAVLGEIEQKPSIWRYVQTPTFKKLIRLMDEVQDTTSRYVFEAIERLEREGIEKPEDEQSVLEKLLKIDKKVATVMAMDMLMAGVDTTSTAFTSVMLCLAKNPEKQAKLREEVMRLLPQKNSKFTEQSLKNIPYLRACIKEGLRIYPLAFGSARVVDKDVVLGGYRVPKGSTVTMISAGLMTDDKHYPRANEFLPERWLRPDKKAATEGKCPISELKASSPFVYLPFGFGARSCVGKRIVEMELELGLARIIRNFQVEFNHSTDNAFRTLLFNVPNIPLKFKFTDVDC